ncbi:TPA: hypothetical protein N0F65_004699 [Lagenidium giganteum]|uniref:Uncharacterized protein n=1 Tax=Lagenidium giganteum TaxID=4803 RepID=A0AAV2Z5Y9_9STRA|nr:TPA: hypothetical protein N0F65_004699 [Lagenidium giganteum]
MTLHNGVQLAVRLADSRILRAPKRSVLLNYSFDGFRSTDEFLVLVMDDTFDVILGMPLPSAEDRLVTSVCDAQGRRQQGRDRRPPCRRRAAVASCHWCALTH